MLEHNLFIDISGDLISTVVCRDTLSRNATGFTFHSFSDQLSQEVNGDDEPDNLKRIAMEAPLR